MDRILTWLRTGGWPERIYTVLESFLLVVSRIESRRIVLKENVIELLLLLFCNSTR